MSAWGSWVDAPYLLGRFTLEWTDHRVSKNFRVFLNTAFHCREITHPEDQLHLSSDTPAAPRSARSRWFFHTQIEHISNSLSTFSKEKKMLSLCLTINKWWISDGMYWNKTNRRWETLVCIDDSIRSRHYTSKTSKEAQKKYRLIGEENIVILWPLTNSKAKGERPYTIMLVIKRFYRLLQTAAAKSIKLGLQRRLASSHIGAPVACVWSRQRHLPHWLILEGATAPFIQRGVRRYSL